MTDCGKGKAGTVHPECIGEKHYSDDHGTGSAIKMSESPDVDLQKDEGGAMPDTSVQNALEKATPEEIIADIKGRNVGPAGDSRPEEIAYDKKRMLELQNPEEAKRQAKAEAQAKREADTIASNGEERSKRLTERNAKNAMRNKGFADPSSTVAKIASIVENATGRRFDEPTFTRLLGEVISADATGGQTRSMKPEIASAIRDAYHQYTETRDREEAEEAQAKAELQERIQPKIDRAVQMENIEASRTGSHPAFRTSRNAVFPGGEEASDDEGAKTTDEVNVDKGNIHSSGNAGEWKQSGRRREEANREAKGDSVGRTGTHGQDFTPKKAGKDFELTQSPENVEEHRQKVEDVKIDAPKITPATDIADHSAPSKAASDTYAGKKKTSESSSDDPMPDRDTKTQSHGKMPSMAELMKSAEQRTIDARGAPSGYKSYGHSFNGQSIPIQNGYRQVFITRNDPVMPPVSEMKVTKN